MLELFECVNVWFCGFHGIYFWWNLSLKRCQPFLGPISQNCGINIREKIMYCRISTNIYFSSISNYPHVTKYHRYSQACSFLVQILWSWSRTRSQNLDTGEPRPHSVICLRGLSMASEKEIMMRALHSHIFSYFQTWV